MGGTVLLIGENRELVDMTARMLRRSGYCVSTAVGLQQARLSLARQIPGLVLMNCQLPEGSGIACCRQFRSEGLPVKILMVSGSQEDEVQALDAGADDFIKEPYRMEVLLARMKRLLA